MEIAAFLPECLLAESALLPASKEVAEDIPEEVIHIPALIVVFPVTAIRALIEAGIGGTAIWAGMAELVVKLLLFRVA